MVSTNTQSATDVADSRTLGRRKMASLRQKVTSVPTSPIKMYLGSLGPSNHAKDGKRQLKTVKDAVNQAGIQIIKRS